MTTAQVNALFIGLIGFLTIWGIVLVPQLALQHVRFGRVVPRRVATTAALIAYASFAVAVTFFPVPDADGRRLEQTIQLVPFQWITDMRSELHKYDLSAAHALTTQTFEQMTLNILLFVPLGLFARLLWKRGFIGTVLLGAAISLTVEITQLTANFGTAPFQYRIFDVDDLITNTTGAALGWIAAALFLVLRSAVQPVRQPARHERVHLTEAR
ncbi:VanZ family protein [Amycolatopsis endophytica]|uniref:Glycopeptide antibiotics resistance protein n=1 Tax=Amycolatopsis endophytica TaxID=860233 RepID=A0A853B160_9PSEU|nr:VanZ family protein [Amycolatopsis endophytica]NYI88587.1 glycopeptide antibiotics resistance protein [Amycolatopsis endophytica]